MPDAALVDLSDFATKISRAFEGTADRVEEVGGVEEALRIREAHRLWRQVGPTLPSVHAMAQHALDATLLTGAGLDGQLTWRWQQLAEQNGPIVTVPLQGDLPEVLSTVSPLRLARTIALTVTSTGNTDLQIPGGRERLADLAASVMWSDAARDVSTPTTLEKLSRVVEVAVEDVAEVERDPQALGPVGERLPDTRKRLGGVVVWLRALGEQHPTAMKKHRGAPWWLQLGAALIILVALSELLASLGVEAQRARK